MLAFGGFALLFPACLIFAILPWLAVACAAAAFGIGCHLHRNRRRVDSDALHLCRIVLLSGGAMMFMAALVATRSPLSWIVVILSTLPILPSYFIGFYGLVTAYAVGYFILLVMIVASGPDKPPLNSASTNRE